MPLPPPVRLTLSVVSLCALAVPLAACGAKDATSTSATATHVNVRQADTSTEAVGEFLDRVHAGIGNAGTVHVVANATGAMSGSAVGDVSYGPDGPLLQMTAHLPMLGAGRATLIVVGHTAYVSVPGFTPPGKFVAIDKHMMRSMPSMPSIPGLSGISPDDIQAAVRSAVVGVDDLGSADVAGTATTHYRVHLDPAKVVRTLSPDDHAMPIPPGDVVADVWLDHSDRIRRVSTELKGTRVDVMLSQWGQPVDIEAPPADDVVKAPAGAMPGLMMGGSAGS